MSRFPPVRQWRLHLGAHKTATTHLQDILAAHRPALLDRDVDYLPVADARPVLRRAMRRGRLDRGLLSMPLAHLFRRDLARLRKGPATVLLSEEDLLGYSFDQLTDPLYAGLPGLPLLRVLARRGADLHLFVALRSLDGLIPSAYAQTIKAIAPEPGGFEAVRARLRDRPPSWLDLVTRLAAALPDARLTLWRYEDWRLHWQEILDLYVGQPAGPYPVLPPPAVTQSPSGAAIALAEALDPSLPMTVRSAQVRAIYAAHPAGANAARFAPLSDAEIAHLRARYAADIDAIAERFPGCLVRFGSDARTG